VRGGGSNTRTPSMTGVPRGKVQEGTSASLPGSWKIKLTPRTHAALKSCTRDRIEVVRADIRMRLQAERVVDRSETTTEDQADHGTVDTATVAPAQDFSGLISQVNRPVASKPDADGSVDTPTKSPTEKMDLSTPAKTREEIAELVSTSRSVLQARTEPALLPPAAADAKPCLVLDLDETLVHSRFLPCDENFECESFDATIKQGEASIGVRVLKRPGCEDFLRKVCEKFEVVVWTASVAAYCDAVMDDLDPEGLVKHRLSRNHCSRAFDCPEEQHEVIVVKDLQRLGRNLEQTLIIDNNPECYLLQPQNALPINDWFGNNWDDELTNTWSVMGLIMQMPSHSVGILQSIARSRGWNRGACDQ